MRRWIMALLPALLLIQGPAAGDPVPSTEPLPVIGSGPIGREAQEGHGSTVAGLMFSPDGKLLASASLDKSVRLWDLTNLESVATLKGHQQGVTGLTYSPDGKQLATAGQDGEIKIWSMESRQVLHTLVGHKGAITSIAYSAAGGRLITSGSDSTVRFWDPATGQQVGLLNHGSPVGRMAVSPGGKLIAASGGLAEGVDLWDANGERVAGAVGYALAFSPDGRYLLTGGLDGTLRLWDSAGELTPGGGTLPLLNTWREHDDTILALTFSPDGARAASAGADSTVRLWVIPAGKVLASLHGHGGSVGALAFRPDGRMLATGGADHTIKLWDGVTGRLLASR